ncbi:MAG: hypothetical protein ABIT01_02260 [Thermoanaerobaculia bacterium]
MSEPPDLHVLTYAGSDSQPAVSSDGKLLFASNRSGHFEIWMAERDGNGARCVSSDGKDAENPSMTPDGRWIVYASADPLKRGIWKVRPNGSSSTLLAGGQYILPEISPDGTLVSFSAPVATDTNIRAVRLSDGAPVSLDIPVKGDRFSRGRHRWLAGSEVAMLVDNDKGGIGVVREAFSPGHDTAATRRLIIGIESDSLVESLGISPDGTRMTLGEVSLSTNLILAEGIDGVLGVPGTARK